MAFSIYVAAATRDSERAELWMNKLRDAGVIVTSTWIEVIRKVGVANPRDATREQRAGWASTDVAEVMKSDGLWMLMSTHQSFGMPFEFGFAFGKGLTTWASGQDLTATIFTALATCQYDDDQDAFDDIVRFARTRNDDGLRGTPRSP